MQKVTQKYRQAKLDELQPHPDNPRQGDVGAIHTSIEQNGFYGAILVQKSTQRILAGHHRYQAAQHAGASTVPVIELDVDDPTALRILLADNRTNDLASYDNAALAAVLSSIAQENPEALLGTGYDGDDLDDLLALIQEEPPNADGNVRRAESQNDRLPAYEASATRAVLLEYALPQFRWVVDSLGKLRDEMSAESSAEVVQRLIEEAVGEKCP